MLLTFIVMGSKLRPDRIIYRKKENIFYYCFPMKYKSFLDQLIVRWSSIWSLLLRSINVHENCERKFWSSEEYQGETRDDSFMDVTPLQIEMWSTYIITIELMSCYEDSKVIVKTWFHRLSCWIITSRTEGFFFACEFLVFFSTKVVSFSVPFKVSRHV